MSSEDDHSDDNALAGEYVLRLLDGAEQDAFESRLAQEPALRDLVRDWESEFAILAEDIDPVAPPAALKSRLRATLFAEPVRPRSSVWQWLVGGVVAAGLIAGAMFYGTDFGRDGALGPSLTASIVAEDGSLIVAASFVPDTNTLAISRLSGSAVPGRALELWLIADGADAPVSLGVLPSEADTQIELPEDLAAQMAGAVLAISDEPPGGSPTGAPTGAVLAVGPVSEV